MQNEFTTERLQLRDLGTQDTGFIIELLNSPGWIRFIGNRNVNTAGDAKAYIQKVTGNPNIQYWVVNLKENKIAVGVITLIKRDYLEHHDIGFAFLPQYEKRGFAFEASKVVLENALELHKVLLATTLAENLSSIKLLTKLGFTFDKEIENNGERLRVYKVEKN
ncbi:MAG TPA: GNAT family N-acetyltransferase [Bacteroidia bacterium]|jgi:RimJ/RimL family protein N-acetyltransferase